MYNNEYTHNKCNSEKEGTRFPLFAHTNDVCMFVIYYRIYETNINKSFKYGRFKHNPNKK